MSSNLKTSCSLFSKYTLGIQSIIFLPDSMRNGRIKQDELKTDMGVYAEPVTSHPAVAVK